MKRSPLLLIFVNAIAAPYDSPALVIRIASFDARLPRAQAYDGTILDNGSAPGVDD
jgi:hypothetical protein